MTFPFWYRKFMGNICTTICALIQDFRLSKMDFHALMKKKLGGKYVQPKFTENYKASEETVAS